MNISLYIHIPFCKRKCPYCNFYSIDYDRDLANLYIDVLSRELKNLDNKFYTIYIGGGTPTVLSLDQLERLLKYLYKFSKEAYEFTIEANPESLSEEKLKLFIDNRINRISIGVQSFCREKLEFLGRIHTEEEAVEAVFLAKKVGFRNINIDLIFGIPNETFSSWREDLKKAISLPIKHISVYSLTCERKTKFYRYKNLIDEGVVAKMYIYSIDTLRRYGFYQYEISNFSKKNFQCKHNLVYWDNGSYIGLGCGSFSYIDGVREKKIEDVKKYIDRFFKKDSLVIFREKLSKIKMAKETAALKIRTIPGIDFDWFYKKTNLNFIDLEKDALSSLKKDGLIEYKKRNKKIVGVKLTKKGLLFSDTVSSSLV